jgi:DNA-binding XRE family transcriptional regulator
MDTIHYCFKMNEMKEIPEYVTRGNCGRVLRELRQRFGSMSVAELAKTLGVARSTVMRIESGRTTPSDDLLNRLKAIQVIGLSRFRVLSEEDRVRFVTVLEEIGESPEMFSRAVTNGMVKELTPGGILVGLGAIASASLNVATSIVSSIPVLSSLAGYGLVKGLKSVLAANNLSCVESDGVWEITREGGSGPKKEAKKMNQRKEEAEKNGGASFDFGLGGLFKGLGNLVDAANRLAEKGEGLSRSGEIDLSGLDKVKGLNPTSWKFRMSREKIGYFCI